MWRGLHNSKNPTLFLSAALLTADRNDMDSQMNLGLSVVQANHRHQQQERREIQTALAKVRSLVALRLPSRLTYQLEFTSLARLSCDSRTRSQENMVFNTLKQKMQQLFEQTALSPGYPQASRPGDDEREHDADDMMSRMQRHGA